MAEVHQERRENVAVLTLDRPVANALAPSLRADLLTALDAAIADPEVQAIVLQGAGGGFSSGVDISEFDAPLQAPWISDLCTRIENSPKPVVAALQGAVLGGGLELALAAHVRVVAAGTRVALPEVTLGLTPGGGATQRLPRLIGAQAGLELMLSGQIVDATDPRLKNMVDISVAEAPLESAIARAAELAKAGTWPRTGDRAAGLSDPRAYQNAVSIVAERLQNKQSAEADIVRCVEAALLLPFDRGLDFEQAVFDDRRVSAAARARRHLFVAERRARIMPERASGRASQVADVAILGLGDLAVELAVACLDAGLRVWFAGTDAAGSAAARMQIAGIYDAAVTQDRLSVAARDECLSRLTIAEAAQALPQADLVLDTGQMDVKDSMGRMKRSVVWALLVGDASVAPVPPAQAGLGGRLLGLRVYRPAYGTALAELAVPPGSSADAVVTLAQLLSRMGRIVIRCAPARDLVGHNLSAALFNGALALAEAGAMPYRIDVAARKLGYAAGPFAMMDREGLPQVLSRLMARATEEGTEPPKAENGLLASRIAQGAKGRASGRGFYLYDAKGVHPDPGLPKLGATLGLLSDADMASALEAALVNEAARLLSTQTVQRASDIDLVMVRSYGYDQAKGGPLLQADLRGMFRVLKQMQRFAPVSAAIWQPHPMILELVKNGEGFFGRAG